MTGNRSVFFFIHALRLGGAERTLSLLSQFLPDSYKPTFVVHLVQKDDFDYKGELISYDLPKYKSKIIFYAYALVRNIILIRNRQPDVIVSSLQFTDLLVLLTIFLMKLLFMKTPPVIIRIESAREVNPPRGFRLRLLGWLFKFATAFVVVSEKLREPLAKNFNIPEAKITCIYNGVSLPLDHSLVPYIKRDFLYDIISIGRLTEAKDHETMLKVIQELISVHQLKGLRVCIVGGGEEEKRVLTLATKLELNNNITFTGTLPFEKGQALLLQSKVFLLTSKWEGFGIVLIEAMSKGVPVVSTDCNYGPQEILENGRFGLLAPVGDVSGIANKTATLLQDQKLREELSEKGQERVKRFGIERIAREHSELFDRIIAKK